MNANDIVGLTLYAKKKVDIKALPYDSEEKIRTIPKGGVVGVVDSYLNPTHGRKKLYWMFYDQNSVPYYAVHDRGLYDQAEVEYQIQEQEKEQGNSTENWYDFNMSANPSDYLPDLPNLGPIIWGLGILLALVLLSYLFFPIRKIIKAIRG